MSPLLHLSSPVCLAVFLSLFCKIFLLIFGIFSTVFSVFLVFFASYHFVSHPKNSVSLQSETSETNLFFAISLRSFSLLFRFVSLPSEMMGHPNLNPYFLYPSKWLSSLLSSVTTAVAHMKKNMQHLQNTAPQHMLTELGARLQNNVASRAYASFSNGVGSHAIAYFSKKNCVISLSRHCVSRQ